MTALLRTAVGFSLVLIGAGCDPIEHVSLVRADGKPFLCPDGRQTSYEVGFPVLKHPYEKQEVAYLERTRRMAVKPYDALSTNPDSVTAGVIRGSMGGGRIPWLQFSVYCADAATPFVVTPRITASDLTKEDNYYYVVR